MLLSPLQPNAQLLADRGYDADWVRAFVAERGAWSNIRPRTNRISPICFSPHLYRDRNRIERFFNRIKHCRRVATRYDKLAANYLAFIKLACIRPWLQVYESTSRLPEPGQANSSDIVSDELDAEAGVKSACCLPPPRRP